MPSGELVFRTHVEHGYEAILEAAHKLPPTDGLQCVTLMKVAADELADFRQVLFGDAAERRDQIKHRWAAQAVKNALAVAARHQQAGPAH